MNIQAATNHHSYSLLLSASDHFITVAFHHTHGAAASTPGAMVRKEVPLCVCQGSTPAEHRCVSFCICISAFVFSVVCTCVSLCVCTHICMLASRYILLTVSQLQCTFSNLEHLPCPQHLFVRSQFPRLQRAASGACYRRERCVYKGNEGNRGRQVCVCVFKII